MYPSPRDERIRHLLAVDHQVGARRFSSGDMAEERVLVGEVLRPGGCWTRTTAGASTCDTWRAAKKALALGEQPAPDLLKLVFNWLRN